MKTIMLEVPDDKAAFALEVLKSISFVKKAHQVKAAAKEHLLEELKEAVTQLTLIEKGQLKSRPAKALLNEL
jgi:hypothetical protein